MVQGNKFANSNANAFPPQCPVPCYPPVSSSISAQSSFSLLPTWLKKYQHWVVPWCLCRIPWALVMANLVYLLLVLTLPLNPKQSSREAIPGTSPWGFFCHRRNVLYGQDFSCMWGVSFACQAVLVHVRGTSMRPAAVKMWAAALFQYVQIHCWAPAPSCWPISNPLKTGRLVTTVFFWLNLLF